MNETLSGLEKPFHNLLGMLNKLDKKLTDKESDDLKKEVSELYWLGKDMEEELEEHTRQGYQPLWPEGPQE
ncbi:MAG: hypothetical protein LBS00_02275 [Synergistaceae bacterium]|jgi:hypothetical protein|nr:hypothetical protein [Synergistaceae bacterium]